MNADQKAMTDVELVSEWLEARKSGTDHAHALLAEASRRGSKRITKAFEAVNTAQVSP